MAFVWLVIGAVILVFAGSLIASAFRWLARIALACLMAVTAGVLVTLFAPADVEKSWAIPLTVLMVFLVGLFALMHFPRVAMATDGRVAPSATPRGPSRRLIQHQNPWDALSEAAPDYSARIVVARRSCDRLSVASKGRLLDMRAHESRILLEKRVPQLIRQELDRSATATSAQSDRILRELIEFLERVAADCERRLDGWKPDSGETDDVLRRHIENYLHMTPGHSKPW